MLAIPGVEVNSLEAGGIRFLRTQVCNFQIKISNCHKYNNNKSLGNKRESRIVKMDKKTFLEKILTSTAEQPSPPPPYGGFGSGSSHFDGSGFCQE